MTSVHSISVNMVFDPQTRWPVRWKPALNAFAITFADRMPAAEDR
jgi:transposase-like protein